MYLRTTSRKNKDGSVVTYYTLAHNYRDPATGQTRARNLYSFGRADQLDREALARLCRSIARVCDLEVRDPSKYNDGGSREGGGGLPESVDLVGTRELGVVLVMEELWKRLGIGQFLTDLEKRKRLRVPYERAIFAMVVNRLCEPMSKLGVWERWLEKVYLPACWSLKRAQFYEAMDVLHAHAEELERKVFTQTRHLFNLEVDVIFYDTTTASFAIDEEDSDDEDDGLRKRGCGKDGGWGPQVVVALAVTKEGIPVRSWVFPGNTADVTTVRRVKADLREWRLGRCLFVGDAGMNSEENREALAGPGEMPEPYLLATRAAAVKEVRKDVLGTPGRYQQLADNLEVKEVDVGPAEAGKRYFVCRNLKEARRKKKHREEVLAGIRSELNRHRTNDATAKWAIELLSSRRTSRYLTVTKTGKLRIDNAKVRAAERLDGRWVLQTNDERLTPAEAASGYKAMLVIERCFARLKSVQIEMTPMHHRLRRRIKAHVKVCVLALFLQRVAERECDQSWSRIRDVLWHLQATEFRTKSNRFFRRNSLPSNASQVLRKLKITPPRLVLHVAE